MDYATIYSRLTYETAGVIFMKKNGEIRLMLCTRNLKTVEIAYGFKGTELGGHDRRCNINNGNIAVIDMYLGEARSFNVERLVDIEFYGEIKTKEQLDEISEQFSEFSKKYSNAQESGLTMDMLD